MRKHYSGKPGERFGPTLTAEHLEEEHGIGIDAETLRRWMLAEGLWTRERKRKPYRQRRVRRAHFGELVQMDGSFHDWLEERGPRGCLIHMVDDATTQVWGGLGRGDDLGSGGDVAGVGDEIRSAAGPVRGLEECVSVGADGAAEAGRDRAGFAVRADVRQAGDRADRSEFGAGERAGGAGTRDAPGPADQEDAAEEDQQL